VNLANFKTLTFDCYGTLVDWEAGILGVLRPWAGRAGIVAGDEELLAAFADAETRVQQAMPRALYPDVLRGVHARIAAHWGKLADASDADALAESVGDWPAFADSPAALARLKRHHKLVIVSNIDRASFARSQKKLGVEFDAVVTAEEVGAYKPDLRMFRRALEVVGAWGVTPRQVLHVAQSLYHDHVPAKALGLATVWVNRRSGRSGGGAAPAPSTPVQPDLEVASLAALAALEK